MQSRPYFLRKLPQLLLVCGVIGVGLTACANNPPQIEQSIGTRIVRYNSEDQSIHEFFSVFSAVQDKDGFQDIDNMYILDDASQLLWHLTGSDLQTIDNNNRHWVGNHNLVMPKDEAMPVGKIRIIIYDRAGNKALSEVGLPLMEANLQEQIPKAKRKGDILEIIPSAAWEKMDREIIIQDWSGAELSRYRSSGSSVKIDALLNGRKAADVHFSINDHLFNGSLLISSGPW